MTYVLPAPVRKFALTVHLACSVGWIGAVLAYLALVVSAMTTRNAQTVRAAWIGMESIGWFVLVPLAVAALATGLALSLGTRWGLFRHYWVLFTLLLTVLAAAVLLGHMPTVSYYAGLARAGTAPASAGLQGELLHAGGGLVVLLLIAGLNVYKPRGMTPYGRRKLRDQRTGSEAET